MFKLLQNKIALYALGVFLILIVLLSVTIKLMYNRIDTLKYEKNKWRDNYTAQTLETWKWKTKTGEVVASSVAEILTKNEIIDSKDHDIQKLNEYAGKLDIKIKNLQAMISVSLDTVHDTIVRPDVVYLPGGKEYIMYDTVPIGKSFIYRVFNSTDSLARYRVELRGNLYLYYEGEQKQGKWKLINLFVWREKLPIISAVSDSPLINVQHMKMVVIDKKKRSGLFK